MKTVYPKQLKMICVLFLILTIVGISNINAQKRKAKKLVPIGKFLPMGKPQGK